MAANSRNPHARYAALTRRVRVRAAPEEHVRNLIHSPRGSIEQRRIAVRVSSVHVSAAGNKALKLFQPTGLRRFDQLFVQVLNRRALRVPRARRRSSPNGRLRNPRDRRPGLRHSRIPRSSGSQKSLRLGVASGGCYPEAGDPVGAGRVHVRALLNEHLRRLGHSPGRGVEERSVSVSVTVIDVRAFLNKSGGFFEASAFHRLDQFYRKPLRMRSAGSSRRC